MSARQWWLFRICTVNSYHIIGLNIIFIYGIAYVWTFFRICIHFSYLLADLLCQDDGNDFFSYLHGTISWTTLRNVFPAVIN